MQTTMPTMVRGVAVFAGLAFVAASTRSATAADTVPPMCGSLPLAVVVSGAALPSPCTAAPGTLLLEALYYQNASLVGGTALAAYPLVSLRAGLAPRLEVVVDLPSQIAESGLRGAGLFPITHSGYGLNYTFAQTGRNAWTAGLAAVPPASLYAPNQNQPKYRIDVVNAQRLSPQLTLKGAVALTTSHTAGFGTILPSAVMGADLAAGRTARTVFSVDVGTRYVARRASAQGFGDIGVRRQFRRTLVWNLGLGTAFNPVANAKAHYLSTGLAFRP